MSTTEITLQPQAAIARPSTFAPTNIHEAMQFADLLLSSGMAPKSYVDLIAKKGSDGARAAVVIALQFGMELGLQPMQALQGIASINGQPAIWGDTALGLVHASGVCDYVVEQDFETIKAAKKAVCKVRRKGGPEVIRTFSYEDAIAAGIFANAVWKTYPYRMCQMRARSFALRDAFPDVLKGLVLAEEVQDYPVSAQSDPQQQTAMPVQETTIAESVGPLFGAEKARPFYLAYKRNHSVEKMREYISKQFGVTDSREIPQSAFETAMAWANSPGDVTEGVAEPAKTEPIQTTSQQQATPIREREPGEDDSIVIEGEYSPFDQSAG